MGEVERRVRKRKEKTKTGWGNAGSEAPSLYLPPYFDAYRKLNRKEKTTARCTPKISKAKELQPSPQVWREPEGEQSRAFLQTQNSPQFQLLTLTTLPAVRTKTQAFKRQYRPEGPRERLAFAWQMSGSPPSTLPRPDSIVFFFVEYGSLSPCGGESWGCLHSDANSPRGQMRR